MTVQIAENTSYNIINTAILFHLKEDKLWTLKLTMKSLN